MADPIELSIDDLLADFARENATLSTRAVLAEAKNRRFIEAIAAQQKRIEELEGILDGGPDVKVAPDAKDDEEAAPEKLVKPRAIRKRPAGGFD